MKDNRNYKDLFNDLLRTTKELITHTDDSKKTKEDARELSELCYHVFDLEKESFDK